MEYCRGDIYYVNQRTLQKWNDPKFERPAVIVSSDYGNAHGQNVTVVYLTTEEKRSMRVHVNVMCKVPSTAMCENIETIPKTMLGQYIRSCTDEEMQRIDQGIRYALQLNQIETVNPEKAKSIRELEALLEAEKGTVSELRDVIKDRDARINALFEHNNALEIELSKRANDGQDQGANDFAEIGIEFLKVQAERDVYKRLFEQFFDLKKEA